MYLSRLYIENYRSIKQIDLKFEHGKNVIVGRNNAGKSNIIKAIDLVLGDYSPTYNRSETITENDFYSGDTNNKIFIWCEINREYLEDGILESLNFGEVAKSAFFRVFYDKYNNDPISLTITDFHEKEKESIFEFCSEEGQAKIDSNSLFKKWIGGKSYCKGHTFDIEFTNKTKFAIAFRCYCDLNNTIQKELVLLYRENDSHSWIQGINCNIRNVLLQSAIIPSFRDPKDQLRINAFTWFGKLLKNYIKADNEELNKAFNSVKEVSNTLFKDLESQVSNSKTNIAFPNTKISFLFNPDTKQDIHKSTLIYINDGFNSELKDKGAGIQSAIIIGLFDFYIRNIAHSGSSLLAIEEPELYLHPHGRRVIADKLTNFIDEGKNQVIITTHSPEFISSIENQNIISVRKQKSSTTAKNIQFNTPKRKQILIKKQNAELFFSDSVILTEGADKYLMEESAKEFGKKTEYIDEDGAISTLGENWLNDYNISILNCGGKTELFKYVEILRELKIDYITTADFDFLRDGLNDYFIKLGFSVDFTDNLNAIKSKISKHINSKYKYLNQLRDDDLKENVSEYLKSLFERRIYIFSGELENFYKVKPKFDKEAGVLETIGNMIEQNKPISDFINTEEYNELFTFFLQKIKRMNLLSPS